MCSCRTPSWSGRRRCFAPASPPSASAAPTATPSWRPRTRRATSCRSGRRRPSSARRSPGTSGWRRCSSKRLGWLRRSCPSRPSTRTASSWAAAPPRRSCGRSSRARPSSQAPALPTSPPPSTRAARRLLFSCRPQTRATPSCQVLASRNCSHSCRAPCRHRRLRSCWWSSRRVHRTPPGRSSTQAPRSGASSARRASRCRARRSRPWMCPWMPARRPHRSLLRTSWPRQSPRSRWPTCRCRAVASQP
mmetsp:Transcript_134723/g.430427  ORF Transcript_134723/g.430427 Transcript_134723/m.430427 type:complete len:248 (+) Transcript_134723:4286-5029(+)